MKRSEWIRTLSWLVPMICFVLAGILVFMQYRKLQTAREEGRKTDLEISTLKDQIKNFKVASGANQRIPYAQDSRLEESMFLDSVRQKALAHAVHLDRWSNEAVPANTAPPAGTPTPPEAMKNVRTLASSVEVRGDYDAVRSFVRDLLGSPRLLSIKTGTWTRGKDGSETTFSFRLQRYVSNQPPPAIQPSAMAYSPPVRLGS